MSTPTKLFDTHCHFFRTGFEGTNGVRMPAPDEELQAYERFRTAAGVERSLVVGYDEGPYAGNSDYIESLAADRSWITPLTFTASAGEPSKLASAYLGDVESADQFVANLLSGAEAGRAPSIASLNATPAAIAVLEPVLRKLEETWFLIAHLGLPGPDASGTGSSERYAPVLSLSGASNVSVKISGQYAASNGSYPHVDLQPMIDEMADVLGVSALVWGSDFAPVLDYVPLDHAIACILPSGISNEEMQAIYYQNAKDKFEQFVNLA